MPLGVENEVRILGERMTRKLAQASVTVPSCVGRGIPEHKDMGQNSPEVSPTNLSKARL